MRVGGNSVLVHPRCSPLARSLAPARPLSLSLSLSPLPPPNVYYMCVCVWVSLLPSFLPWFATLLQRGEAGIGLLRTSRQVGSS